MSAQDNRRLGRTVVCGALLVYGCLRIPAAAQPAEVAAQGLQKPRWDVREVARPPHELTAVRLAAARPSSPLRTERLPIRG